MAQQLGYSTPGSSDLMGRAVLATYEHDTDGAIPWKKIALEGATNINYAPLQERMLSLLQTGDLDMVAVAARALSSPQALSLPAATSTLQPLLEKVERFLAAGRKEDAEGARQLHVAGEMGFFGHRCRARKGVLPG